MEKKIYAAKAKTWKKPVTSTSKAKLLKKISKALRHDPNAVVSISAIRKIPLVKLRASNKRNAISQLRSSRTRRKK